MPDRDTAVMPETSPGVATADSGEVLLDGPDGIAISMTPDAAADTGKSLSEAASEARTQQIDRPSPE